MRRCWNAFFFFFLNDLHSHSHADVSFLFASDRVQLSSFLFFLCGFHFNTLNTTWMDPKTSARRWLSRVTPIFLCDLATIHSFEKPRQKGQSQRVREPQSQGRRATESQSHTVTVTEPHNVTVPHSLSHNEYGQCPNYSESGTALVIQGQAFSGMRGARSKKTMADNAWNTSK